LQNIARNLNDNNFLFQISSLTLDLNFSTQSLKNNFKLLNPFFMRIGIIIAEEILDHLALIEEATMNKLLNEIMIKIELISAEHLSLAHSSNSLVQNISHLQPQSSRPTVIPVDFPHSVGNKQTLTPQSERDLRLRHMAQRQENLYLRQLREQQVVIISFSFHFIYFFTCIEILFIYLLNFDGLGLYYSIDSSTSPV
jgi:hypothetical protein